MIKKIATFLCLMTISTQIHAIDSASVSYGQIGRPDGVKLARAGVQWNWNRQWFQWGNAYLDGYFDLSLAYLHNNGDENNDHRNLGVISIAPIFRYIYTTQSPSGIDPFLEAGVGPSLISDKRFGTSNMTTYYQFDDRIGAGFRFGSKRQYDFSLAYQHYSNASIKSPNSGLDVKVVGTLRYRFPKT